MATHEELYLHISAETFETVDAAVALIELLVTPVSGNPAAVSTTPTSVSRTNVNVLIKAISGLMGLIGKGW